MKRLVTNLCNLCPSGMILAGSLAALCLPSACSTAPQAPARVSVTQAPAPPRDDARPASTPRRLHAKTPEKKPANTPSYTAKRRPVTPAPKVQSEPGDVQVDARTRAKMASTPKPKVESEVPNGSEVR